MQNLRTTIKRSASLLGVALVLGILVLPSLLPAIPVSADFNAAAPLNVWNGSTVASAGISASVPFWPMSSKTVNCWPVLHQHASAVQIMSDNNIPMMSSNSDLFTAVRAPMTGPNTAGATPTGTMATAFKSANDGSNTFNIITFDSKDSSSDCKRAGMVVQYPAGSTTWYGSFVASVTEGAIGSYKYVDFTATVSPDGTIKFLGPMTNYTDRFGSNGQYTNPPPRQNYGPQKINNWSASVLSGGGTGSGGGNACPADGHMSEVQSQTQEDACVNYYKQFAFFANQKTIEFAGGTFTATQWGGGGLASYVLTDPGQDKDWLKCGKSVIVFEWSVTGQASGALSISGGSDGPSNLAKFQHTMNTIGSGGTLNVDIHNINCHKTGDPTKGNNAGGYKNSFDLNTRYLNVVADYNPADNTVTTKFTDGGGNEKQVIGTYTYAPPAVQYTLAPGGSGCQDNGARPYFTFDRILTDKSLGAGEDITGVWHMNQKGSCAASQFVDVNVRVEIGDANQSAPVPPDPSAGGKDQTSTSCTDVAGAVGWLLCLVIDGLSNAVNGIYSHFIVPMLQAPSLDGGSSSGSRVKAAWATFRVFGNIFLVIVVLVMVFGESIGGGMVDAYTIKKVLPRILAGAILINLSYYISSVFIDLSNIIGDGIRLLILHAFNVKGNGFDVTTVNGSAQTTTSGITLLGLYIGWGALATASALEIAGSIIWFLFAALPWIFLLFLSIMGVLAIRLGLIYALVMFSPVAFALWILPNTEKYFKKWWELLQTTAMVFPIVSALFGLSAVMAQATLWAGGSKGAIGGTVSFVVSLIMVVMPLVLIPFAFKLAGGILGRAYELASNGRKLGGNWFKQRSERRMNRALGGTFFNKNGIIGRTRAGEKLNEAMQTNAQRKKNEDDLYRGTRFGFTKDQRKTSRERIERNMANALAAHEAQEALKKINAQNGGDEVQIKAMIHAIGKDGKFDEQKFRTYLKDRNYTPEAINGSVATTRSMMASMGTRELLAGAALATASSGTVEANDNILEMMTLLKAHGGLNQGSINAMLAAAEAAKAAGRVDQYSSSPTDNINALKAVYENVYQKGLDHESDAAEQISQTLLKQAKESRSPGEMAMAKGGAIERFAPLMVEDVHAQQRVLVQTKEYHDEQAAKQNVQLAEQAVNTADTNRRQVALQLENARAQVRQGGVATDDQQKAINDALQAQRDVELELQRAQGNYQVAVNVHQAARNTLESTTAHKELMHQLARVKGMEDIAAQIPDGKAKAYVETAFAAKGVVGVDASGKDVLGDASLSALYNSRDVTSNETFRQYHREYSDAEAMRSAGYQAAASAAAGTAGAPPGAPGAGPTSPSDRRLKRNIGYLHTTPEGIKLYRFQYLWSDQVYVGVMAQDLVTTHPEALAQDEFGFYSVNYETLGLQMLTLSQWQEAHHSSSGAVR